MNNTPTLSPPEQLPRPSLVLWGFVVFNAVFRGLLLGINEGAYSDGVLQVTQFARQDSFWPPLYTALVWVLRECGVDTLWAGRGISWAASVALVWPLWVLARRWSGDRAALYTLLLYTVSPLALRWSVRMMTDMLFVALFHGACVVFLLVWSDRARLTGRMVAFLTLLSVLATLTRYQGLMMAPLVLLSLVALWRERRGGTGLALLSEVLWFALPAWLLFQRFGHVQQAADRMAGGGLGATLLNYWSLFETLLYITPYVLTLPVFGFFVCGVLAGPSGETRRVPVRFLLAYVALAVLCAQAVFQSFQTRYLLPLLPLALTCAGSGVAWLEGRARAAGRSWQRGFDLALVGTVVWSLVFALLVVSLQRGAFGDIYKAGRALREVAPGTAVYTNESYGPHAGMEGINLGFASGRSVEAIPEWGYFLQGAEPPPAARMQAGSIVAVHSRNAFGMRNYRRFLGWLEARYALEPVGEGVYASRIVPLLPDIMGEPGTEQNPLAWVFRYQPQHFETRLLRVGERRTP